jgi:hypothetical protein
LKYLYCHDLRCMFMISGACSSALHLLLDRFEHLDDETVYRAYGGMIHYSTYCLCKGSELQPPLSLGAIALSSVRIMDQFVCRCTVQYLRASTDLSIPAYTNSIIHISQMI